MSLPAFLVVGFIVVTGIAVVATLVTIVVMLVKRRA